MDIGEEQRVHEVRPKKVPYEGDEVKPNRRKRDREPAKKPAREKEKVGA